VVSSVASPSCPCQKNYLKLFLVDQFNRSHHVQEGVRIGRFNSVPRVDSRSTLSLILQKN
jgi:hypothetical protein